MTSIRLMSFGLIWIAIGLYAANGIRKKREVKIEEISEELN
jgi:hypothetical protein